MKQTEKKTHRTAVRFNAAEYKELEEKAKFAEITTSTLIRLAVKKFKPKKFPLKGGADGRA